MDNKLFAANKIIKEQDEVIKSFDAWVKFVKLNDLEQAAQIVEKAKQLRINIAELKKEYAKLNKKSVIILLNHKN